MLDKPVWEFDGEVVLEIRGVDDADVVCQLSDEYGDFFPNKEVNGSLIAAAPQMRDALESIALFFKNQELSEVGRQMHGKVLEALKKAEPINKNQN